MKKEKIFHVISNTHWDREWRFPFQKNRQMLVEMIDRTLEILQEEPQFRAFHLDSQSVVLEDYLEIKPHRRPVIEKLVKENRLFIGPWYILPEEFQVGGESLIRNLLLGHRICTAFGKVMKVGYSPFSWGQISQLPQLYKEFGVDVILFYRGVNSLDSQKAEFIWEGADGTKVLTSRFSTMPRYNFYFYIYRPVIHDEKFSDIEYKWRKGGVPFHFSDRELFTEDYAILKPLQEYYIHNLKPAVESIIKDQANDFTTEHVMWMDGHDSSGPNKQIVSIINDANRLLGENRVRHSNLITYANSIKESVNYDELKLVKGERRSSQYDRRSGNLYGYTTSARMYLKQINFDTERWLQFYAEPFYAIANIIGLDTTDNYLDIAWKMLLQNSAHDSIGGCSLDTVHQDMLIRYKQAKEIAQGVFDKAAKFLVRNINLPGENDSIHLTVINPLPTERTELAEAWIDIPVDLDQGSISVSDIQKNHVDFQIVETCDSEPVVEQMTDRPMHFTMKRYHCYLSLKNIPPMGYKSYRISPVQKSGEPGSKPLGQIVGKSVFLENEYLLVSINVNGTLNITNKQSGHVFENVAYLYDEGEAGHAWIHKPVTPYIDTLNSSPVIEIIENGKLISRCRIHHKLLVPENLESRNSGSGHTELPVRMDVILKKQSRRVEFEIEVDNKAESHRLRLMFPLNLNATSSLGEGQFDVVERKIERKDTSDWIEQPMYDFPMHHFVAVSNGEQGAAVLVDGLKEYEVLDDAKNTLAITLFRAFEYIIQPSSVQNFSHQKGSQCLGKSNFRMAFYSFSGSWEQGYVYREALCYNNELRLMQSGNTTGQLPAQLSFFSILPENLMYSSFKFSEENLSGSFILRLYNPTDKIQKGDITFFKSIAKVRRVTLEEKDLEEIAVKEENSIQLEVAPKKIISLKIYFDKE